MVANGISSGDSWYQLLQQTNKRTKGFAETEISARIFSPGFPTQILLLCETRIQKAYLSTNGGAAEEDPCACYCNWVGVVWSCILVCILCMYVCMYYVNYVWLIMIDYDCIWLYMIVCVYVYFFVRRKRISSF